MKLKKLYLLSLLLLVFGCKTSIEDDEIEITLEFPTGLKKSSESAHEATSEADIDEDYIDDLPTSFSLTTPPIISQGETSKCVAFSSAYYILGMYNGVKTKDYNRLPSPEFIYVAYKQANEDNNCNDGCYLFSDDSKGIIGVADLLKTTGTTTWNQMPFVDSPTCSVITATHVTQASANKVAGYYRLGEDEYNDVQELKAWLYAGFPIWFGVEIDQGFMNLKAGKIWSKASGKSEGAHAMTLVGYDDTKKAFKIANSWGTDWADAGYGWVDYDYFVKLLGKEADAEIGILVPNNTQRPNMGKVSPGACENASWGDLVINNQRNQEIAVEMYGASYTNDDTDNIDPSEPQLFMGIPKGALKVKILTADKSTLIREYTINISSCSTFELSVN